MSSTSTSKEKPSTQTKMNSTNLYVTTTQIILRSDPRNPNSWQDLYRLVPYLRNSLCCVVCSNLLVDPLTPAKAQCQHHQCHKCKGGRKKIKPACESCKECKDYVENKSLRILLQMYKKMCLNLINSPIFKCIIFQASQPGTGFERGASNLIQLINEGALFEDDYKSQGGLPKSAYSILPCVYTNSVCAPNMPSEPQHPETSNVTSNSNRSSLYSVLYPGTGNKITIKRKAKEINNSNKTSNSLYNNLNHKQKELTEKRMEKQLFKKPCTQRAKKGCRCGNATATPGKLTCCGQRCPCYVESKACIDCKCRGCRNPHRADGHKVMPYIPELEPPIVMPHISELQLQQIHILPPPSAAQQPSVMSQEMQNVKIEGLELETQFFSTTEPVNHQFKAYKLLSGGFDPIQSISATDLLTYGINDDDEDADITVV